MRDRPAPEELLQGARAVLDRDIAPCLQGRARFAAIMVSRAMSVAARAIANGDAPLRAEAQRLAALLGRSPITALAPPALSVVVQDLNRVLTQRIRSGDFDGGDTGQRLYDHLRQVTLDKLSESNPKYFEKDKTE